jgi:hypothetical protein
MQLKNSQIPKRTNDAYKRDTNFCPACKAHVRSGEKYCSRCGSLSQSFRISKMNTAQPKNKKGRVSIMTSLICSVIVVGSLTLINSVGLLFWEPYSGRALLVSTRTALWLFPLLGTISFFLIKFTNWEE